MTKRNGHSGNGLSLTGQQKARKRKDANQKLKADELLAAAQAQGKSVEQVIDERRRTADELRAGPRQRFWVRPPFVDEAEVRRAGY